MTTQAPITADQMRNEFESWASTQRNFGLTRYSDDLPSPWTGNYMDYHVQCAWVAWQAAFAKGAAELREENARLLDVCKEAYGFRDRMSIGLRMRLGAIIAEAGKVG